MRLWEMKAKMLKWRDLYGGDIGCTDRIAAAQTADDLREILSGHVRLMEGTLIDALSDLDDFKRSLGLSDV